jgi:hypothetical protein
VKDEERYALLSTRVLIMDEQWEATAIAWNEARLGDRAQVVGSPDLSVNALREIARQLSTPGLYGYRPTVTHPDVEATAWFLEPDGALDQAGTFAKLQEVQFYALGLGDMFVRIDAEAGHLQLRLVKPINVEIVWHPKRPDEPMIVRELQMRWDTLREQWIYCWDEYDLPGRRFRVLSADRKDDVTGTYEPALVGAWPWVFSDGTPFLPWVKYHWRDTGECWHHHHMRGLTRGTLQACLYATLTGHAAESASGKAVVVSGLRPMGAGVVLPKDGQSGVPVVTIDILPGTFMYHEGIPGVQPLVQEVGPGSDLSVLSEWLWQYVGRLASVYGINGTDILRTSANPTSGASLSIQQRGRREFSNQVEPLFRLRDVELLGKAAAMIRISGGPALPESGYAITYQQIPLSSDERREQREHLDWQAKAGQLSPIDVYKALHPGVSADAARAAIVRAKIDSARIEAEVAAELEKLAGPKADTSGRPTGEPGTFGAQAGQVQMLVKDVAAGQLPRDAAVAVLQTFFQLSEEQAKACLGTAGNGFTPTPRGPDAAPLAA